HANRAESPVATSGLRYRVRTLLGSRAAPIAPSSSASTTRPQLLSDGITAAVATPGALIVVWSLAELLAAIQSPTPTAVPTVGTVAGPFEATSAVTGRGG